MMKKIQQFTTIFILSIVLLSSGGSGTAAQETSFPDVNSSHESWTAIDFLQQNGVFTGYPDGTFQPERVLNRAEQLKVYMLLHSINPSAETYQNCFPDVHNEWFARYVCYASENGIVEGYPDGLFRPAQEVNKVEALKMLAELQGWSTMEPETAPYSDVPAGEWFTKYVYFALDHNLLTETGDIFNPANGISRAATAELMFRSLAVYKLNSPYSEALDPEIVQIDLTSEEPTEENNNQSLVVSVDSISPENGTVKAGGYYDVTLKISDLNQNPVDDADLEIYFWQPFIATNDDGSSPVPMFAAHSQGEGLYEVQVSSTLKGDNILVINNAETNTIHKEAIHFLAGEPFEVSIEEFFGTDENSVGTRKYNVALLDEFNNVIPNVEFNAWSDFGDVTVATGYDEGTEATFTADGFGGTSINFSAEKSGVTKESSIDVDILPFALGGEPGYEVTDSVTEIPVLFYLPTMASSTDYYEIELEIPSELSLIGFSPSPKWASLLEMEQTTAENGNGRILINGSNIPDGEFFDGKIGDIILQGFPEGEFELDGSITVHSENDAYTETLYKEGATKAKKGEKSVYVPLYSRPFKVIKGKSQKTICVDAFIEPGIGVTMDDVKADVKQAEDIFYKNAQNCNCPHFLKIDVGGFVFSKAQWALFTGKNGLDSYDVPDMIEKGSPIKPKRACTTIIYTDDIDHAGQSNRNEKTDELSGDGKMAAHIFVNNAKDSDGTTLAHELSHHLSGHKIHDPDKGHSQGAGKKGNLMSYDEADDKGNITNKIAGSNLTKKQCDLIGFNHWRFSVYPPK